MSPRINTVEHSAGESCAQKSEGESAGSPTGRLGSPNPKIQRLSLASPQALELARRIINAYVDGAKLPDPDPDLKDPKVCEVTRYFAFEHSARDLEARLPADLYETPEHALWVNHSFVLGEKVFIETKVHGVTCAIIREAKFELGYLFIVVQQFLHGFSREGHHMSTILMDGDSFSEKSMGGVKVYPAELQLDEAVWHPKFGSGIVRDFGSGAEKHQVCVEFEESVKGQARLLKGKKLRRVHLSAKPLFSV